MNLDDVKDFAEIQKYTELLMNKKEKVEFVLKHYEEARNNDNLLCVLYWKLFDQVETLEDVIRATGVDVIRRARQNIQNSSGKYPPTDPNVLKKRQKKEKVIKQVFS